MGGFARLKNEFEKRADLPLGNNEEGTFRFLLLQCLFEIAGNLDTIAVEMREQTKIFRANSDRAEAQSKVLMEAAEKIANPVVFPTFPMVPIPRSSDK